MERLKRLFTDPVAAGRLTLPPPGLVALATVGAALLLIVALTRWSVPSDEHAYWLAARRLIDGLPLYDPAATPVTPYAYWYPPVLAQALVPVALVLPSAGQLAWTVLMLGCLVWLAGGRMLVALAFVVFLPVAVEFWFRNIHLILAVLVVLSVERGWLASVGASIKLSPGLGIPWLAARGRWRDAGVAILVGIAILAVSVALSPQAWLDWLSIVGSRGRATWRLSCRCRSGFGQSPASRSCSPRAPAVAMGGGGARRRHHGGDAHAVDDRAQPAHRRGADVAPPPAQRARSRPDDRDGLRRGRPHELAAAVP